MTETAGEGGGYRVALTTILLEIVDALEHGDRCEDDLALIRQMISLVASVQQCVEKQQISDALMLMAKLGVAYGIFQVAPELRSENRRQEHVRQIASSGGSASRKTKIDIPPTEIKQAVQDLINKLGISKTAAAKKLSAKWRGELSSKQILRHHKNA